MKLEIDLDSEVAAALEVRVRNTGLSLGLAVDPALRAGLVHDVSVEPFDLGGTFCGAEPNYNQLAIELEDDEIIQKMARTLSPIDSP